MQLKSTTFKEGQFIPGECAFGIPDAKEHMQLGPNRNPQLSWTDLPAGTRSLVLLCIDPDVPESADDVNQEGRTIPADMARVEFAHWLMVDIPPDLGSIAAGTAADGVVAGGKRQPQGPPGTRQGLNDYTGFLAGDENMQGDYLGYDGPCPPWNDERLHHYRFTLYATDLDRCPVGDRFTLADVREAIAGHVLAEATLSGCYSLNPPVRAIFGA